MNAPPRHSDNLTPFTLARASKHAEIIEILIEAGATTQDHGGDASALAPPRAALVPKTPEFTSPPPGMIDDDFVLDGVTTVDDVDDADDADVEDLACAASMQVALARAESSVELAKVWEKEAAAELAKAECAEDSVVVRRNCT